MGKFQKSCTKNARTINTIEWSFRRAPLITCTELAKDKIRKGAKHIGSESSPPSDLDWISRTNSGVPWLINSAPVTDSASGYYRQ
jgi:hypothetical protein